jgi:hypothetical protein
MNITKQIEEKIEKDPIFAELYEQHESAKFHRLINKTIGVREALSNFFNETQIDKKEKSSYNKLHNV